MTKTGSLKDTGNLNFAIFPRGDKTVLLGGCSLAWRDAGCLHGGMLDAGMEGRWMLGWIDRTGRLVTEGAIVKGVGR